MEHEQQYGPYWIDYRQMTNPLYGVIRRWMHTADEFRGDFVALNTSPFEVLAFGFNTVPPVLSAYGPSMLSPA